MGLPRFELAGTDPADTPWRWWKHDVVTEFWNTDRRPFVWIDDDLAVFDEASAWMTALAPDQALAVVPEASAGLGPEALDRIDSFIARHQRSRGAAKPTRAVE